MGLVFKSTEETLHLTGVPIAFYSPQEDDIGGLVVNFLTVSNPSKEVIASGYETRIPLSAEWSKTVGDTVVGPNDRLAFDLERLVPASPDEEMLTDVLVGSDHSIYAIKAVRVEPNPLAAYR